MSRFVKAIGGLVGVCVLTISALAISSLNSTAQEANQPNDGRSENGRFQISAWGHAGNSGTATNSGHSQANGAYIIDTRTGKVWTVNPNNKITEIGSVNN